MVYVYIFYLDLALLLYVVDILPYRVVQKSDTPVSILR